MAIGIQHQQDNFDDFLNQNNIAGAPSPDDPDAYLDYLCNNQKQHFDTPEVEEQPTNEFNEAGYLSGDEMRTIAGNMAFASDHLAPIVVNACDLAFSGINSIIATVPQDGATEKEKEDLTAAWSLYLKDKNLDVSPSAMLLITIALIYGPKTYNSVKIRQQEQKLRQQERELELLRKQAEEREAALQQLQNRPPTVIATPPPAQTEAEPMEPPVPLKGKKVKTKVIK